ncbi:MAG: hypothetical protein DDT32_01793 [Syntrophomonadaceae bacterium]|nr:hypothetical protein [Bacillota bacterium]MBT9148024.1 hypothetical protein [Bacillota bacterium]
MNIPEKDRSILRELAEKQAEIASLPVNKERVVEWTRLNGLNKGRPLVWINEIPWHEMNVNGELDLQTTSEFCRAVEQQLRTTIYQWNHMQCDMVVEPRFYSPLVIHDTGFGIEEDVDVIRQDEKSNIVSRKFHPQINDEKDLGKIKNPVLRHDEKASEINYQTLIGLFGDILSIEKKGIIHSWFAPWDELIRWWGVQEAMIDLVMRPELVHQAMERLVNAYLYRLQQWRNLNLLSLTDGNYRVGSGGLGYSDELPQADSDPAHVRTIDQWGSATAQIFSSVSPKMHEEFALQYERRWLEQFGLNYYGCCEPLHNKIEILKSIPNLRKISMSPWADVEKTVERTDGKHVLSYKPNPAVFATAEWNPAQVRKDLSEVLDKTRGCVVEVVMKDISTVRYKPQRLWEWSEMAMELVLTK